jgi:hypothetical protein
MQVFDYQLFYFPDKLRRLIDFGEDRTPGVLIWLLCQSCFRSQKQGPDLERCFASVEKSHDGFLRAGVKWAKRVFHAKTRFIWRTGSGN